MAANDQTRGGVGIPDFMAQTGDWHLKGGSRVGLRPSPGALCGIRLRMEPSYKHPVGCCGLEKAHTPGVRPLQA